MLLCITIKKNIKREKYSTLVAFLGLMCYITSHFNQLITNDFFCPKTIIETLNCTPSIKLPSKKLDSDLNKKGKLANYAYSE